MNNNSSPHAVPPDYSAIRGAFYSYHFIGNGAQFRVYAIHNHLDIPTGRVIKVPLDFDETLSVVSQPLRKLITYNTEDEFQAMAYRRTKDILQYKHTLLGLLQGVYGQDRRFMHSLGNLRILQAAIPAPGKSGMESYLLPIFYTQDQVTTVSVFWENFTLAHIPYASALTPQDIKVIEALIDKMIQLNYSLWEYGFFEFVFKPENMGVRQSKHGLDVIWMDAAEYITDLDQAEAILKEKHWLHPLMTHKVDYTYLPSILHEYYAEACEKAFTADILHKRWRRKSLHYERKARHKIRLRSLMTHDPKKLVRLWIERQTVRSSLYSGLLPEQIDSMQIPVEDLTKLLRDRRQLVGMDASDVDIERRLARQSRAEIPAYEQLLLHYLKEQ
jgi:hypothetical protein